MRKCAAQFGEPTASREQTLLLACLDKGCFGLFHQWINFAFQNFVATDAEDVVQRLLIVEIFRPQRDRIDPLSDQLPLLMNRKPLVARIGNLRLGLFLRVLIDHGVEVSDSAVAQGSESESRLRPDVLVASEFEAGTT